MFYITALLKKKIIKCDKLWCVHVRFMIGCRWRATSTAPWCCLSRPALLVGGRRSGRAAPTLPLRGVGKGSASLAQHSWWGAPCLLLLLVLPLNVEITEDFPECHHTTIILIRNYEKKKKTNCDQFLFLFFFLMLLNFINAILIVSELIKITTG